MKNIIDNYIKENRSAIINDILNLIQIKSINGNKAENTRALDFILSKAQAMGMVTRKSSKEDIGIIELGQGEETLGILTHVDVVGIGDTDKWTYPPFEGKLAKGFIWGRGVVDDKGPVVMCLYALKAIKDLEIPLNKKIWLIVGTSEESEWTDIESLEREFGVPDYGFSPDGDFPIYNREKGYCDIEILFKEPCRQMLEVLESGDSVNTIPSKATIKIVNTDEQIFHGISSHSSVPSLGINAICKMAIANEVRKEFNFMKFINDFLSRDYNGSKIGVDSESVQNSLPSERTTIVPTVLSLTEDGVRLNINLRLWFDVTKEKVEEAFDCLKNQYSFSYTIHDFLLPMEVDSNEEFIQVMAQVYEEYGFKSSFQTAVGTSYAKSMKHFVSWGPVFETEPSCAHMEDERLSVESIEAATKMYATYIARMTSPFGNIRKNQNKMSSIEKALALFELFLSAPYQYDVSTLSQRSGLNRTTVYRNLTSLEKSGLLEKNEETKVYSLGPLAKKMSNVIDEKEKKI